MTVNPFDNKWTEVFETPRHEKSGDSFISYTSWVVGVNKIRPVVAVVNRRKKGRNVKKKNLKNNNS